MSYGFVITEMGKNLLAKLGTGEQLKITRIMVGKGEIAEGQNPADFTDLVQPVAQATSTLPLVKENTLSFIVEYRNDLNGGLEEGFWLKEFGVFAQDGENEILLYYATLGDFPQYVQAYINGVVNIKRYPVTIAVSDKTEVVVSYNVLAFVTEERMKEFSETDTIPYLEGVLEETENKIQQKLDEKANVVHEHSADEITSGILPVERGGTGATTAADARTNLGAAASSHTHNYAGSSSAGGAATSSVKLQTARTIDGMNFDGSANIAHFGVCSTAADVAEKTVALAGFVLAEGARVAVYFSNSNTHSNPKLNVNGTGAKAISCIKGSWAPVGQWEANQIVEFVYYSSHWIMITANARRLYTARTLALSGDVAGSTTFDGSANKTITATLANSGVKAGTYGPLELVTKNNGTVWVSNNVGLHGTSAISTWTAKQACKISFRWKVSSEATHDYLTISAAGTQILANTGGATEQTGTLTATLAANQTLVFTYRKDGSGNNGQDRAEISEVKYGAGTADPSTVIYENNVESYFTITNSTYGFYPGIPVANVTVDAKGRITKEQTTYIAPTHVKKADLLATPRTIRTNLGSTGTASFNGTASITPGVTGILPIANGGTGNSTGNAATATKLATARTIDGIPFDGSANIVHFGICNTAAGTAEKTVSLPGFVLVEGARVAVYFANANTAGSSMLNINGTGAHFLACRNGTYASNNSWIAGDIVEFIYYSNHWIMLTANARRLNGSYKEGYNTTANGSNSHAEGSNTIANGDYSHAANYYTKASADYQTAIGKYNKESTAETDKFIIGNGTSDTARSNCFRVTNTSGVYSNSTYKSSGADYAEFFQWLDNNPNNEDRVGLFVTLVGERIRIAKPADKHILGIISGCPSILGDVYDDQWKGMYEIDIYGRPIFEEVEVPAETMEVPDPDNLEQTITKVICEAHTEIRQKLNPDYDPTQEYIPRSERPEWAVVGMMGKLVVIDDGSCEENGWCTAGEGGIAVKSETQTKFRVMKRLDKKHIKVLVL